jgi:hypothetical protein
MLGDRPSTINDKRMYSYCGKRPVAMAEVNFLENVLSALADNQDWNISVRENFCRDGAENRAGERSVTM